MEHRQPPKSSRRREPLLMRLLAQCQEASAELSSPRFPDSAGSLRTP
jgi:hypothetical protein